VTFNHTTMTDEKVRETSARVRGRFEEVLSAGAGGSWTSEDRSYFSSVGLQIRSYAEGGPAGVLTGGLIYETDDCADAPRWGGCVEPGGSGVLATIDARIPAMDPEVASSSIDHYVGSRLSKRCQGASAVARASNRECIADRTRSDGLQDVCLGGNHGAPGYGVFVDSCYSPASGGGAGHSLRRDYGNGGVYALFSSVTVCAERLYGHNAWYQGSQALYTKCPVYRPIELE